MTGRFRLWRPNSRRGWRIAGIIVHTITVVVIVVAREAYEALAEVVVSVVIVISVAIVSSVVEIAAHARTVKVVRTAVAEERFSVSS
jgi:multisubunit Na+/H+ antiporter MnhG subunit